MSVKLIKRNGKNFWRMYVCERAKLPGGKVKKLQKNLLFVLNDKETALKEEKLWKKKLVKDASIIEGRDLDFGEVIRRFEVLGRSQFVGRNMNPQTLKGHISLVRKYCAHWWPIVASEITRGDGREVLRKAKTEMGASLTQQRKIKASINLIYNWGIEEKLIKSVNHSPVFGLYLEKDEEKEKVPQILTLSEVQKLLYEAKKQKHPWYPVWALAIQTGMRSGELYALKWSHIDFNNQNIRVSESYSWEQRATKSTKAGYWRNVPVSESLNEVLRELKCTTGDQNHVLPRLTGWSNGEAAKYLRSFLKRIGIDKEIVFHTLRACFATHLLSSGAEPVKVMAIGGWKDLKTFEIYVRLSGVNVSGVTDKLNVLPPLATENCETQPLYQIS